jgi:predicted amidohydrolase YtcJ
VKALKDSVSRYNAAGITSVYEGHGAAPTAYHALWAQDELTVRSFLVTSLAPDISIAELEKLMRDWACPYKGKEFGDGRLKIGGMFLQFGGNPRVAELLQRVLPYTGWAGHYNNPANYEKFRDLVYLCAKYEIRVNAIVAEQKSLDVLLTLFEEVNRAYPIDDKRWVVQHIAEVNPRNIEQMKRLGVVPTVVPAYMIWQWGSSLLKQIQEENHFTPYKDLSKAGLPLVLGTDNAPPNPFFTIWAAVARKDRETGGIILPSQRLTREEALKAMTINGAYLTFDEKIRGSIEKGKS